MDSKKSRVISVNIGNLDSGEITFILDDMYDIATRSGTIVHPSHETLGTLQQGTVRFSLGYFNN